MTDKGFIREVSNEITRQQLGKSKFTKRKFKIFILTIIIIFVISTISNFLLEKPLDLIWNKIIEDFEKINFSQKIDFFKVLYIIN